jgi:sulfide dehydrogenase cytochrome subunit
VLFATLAALPLAGVADMASPAMLADTCAGCHGPDGKSPGRIPSIKGLSSDAIASAMRRYKDGTRQSTIMGRIARGYSNEEIKAMSDYLAGKR